MGQFDGGSFSTEILSCKVCPGSCKFDEKLTSTDPDGKYTQPLPVGMPTSFFPSGWRGLLLLLHLLFVFLRCDKILTKQLTDPSLGKMGLTWLAF